MKTMVIGMAELGVVKCPQRITTLGLGSCVGVVSVSYTHLDVYKRQVQRNYR